MDATDRTSTSPARPTHALHVRLLSDPGIPTRLLTRTEPRLAEALTALFGIEVHVHRTEATIVLDDDELVDIGTTVREGSAEEEHADIVLALTEMPRLDGTHPLLAEVIPEQDAAVLSLPAIGIVTTRRRLTDVLVLCAAQLLPHLPRRGSLPRPPLDGNWTATPDGPLRLRALRGLGTARTVLGMVATNAPWRLAPRLGRALALAAATGAFGIFYSSVWEMSTALSVLRLALISALAVVTMTIWLIAGNRMWERAEGRGRAATEVFYNLSTVLTVGATVSILYLLLFGFILAAGLIVIDPDYLTAVLARPASFDRYVDIAWLSASMGVVAGGLGASFDSHTDVRTLTHRGRERARKAQERREQEREAQESRGQEREAQESREMQGSRRHAYEGSRST
ncbi:hypothetical protein [Brachybacterium nesterenkovii]|uniref:Uncharacterized protein n=1 Tax=Brachybacterium nesterenkovii TaxID=47847 RepID=A0A1X6WU89_9MICO|nr:hypothetical protein [Brachybacterium nesterenkovii]SLM88620.1 hypothetical protein FM110_02090 [Brachybacterium nesterenkovii]